MTARAATAKTAARHYTRAQNKSFRVYLRRHPQTTATRRAARVTARKATRVAARRGATGAILSTEWIATDNDREATCVSVAVANSLLAATGIRVPDSAVRAFHDALSAKDGVSIPEALARAAQDGIGGVDLLAWEETPEPSEASVVGLTDGFNDHAVAVTPNGLISWGSVLDLELTEDWWLDGEYYSLKWSRT